MNTSRFILLAPLVFLSSACAADTGGQDAEEMEVLRTALAVLADSTPEHLVAGQQTFVAACASCHGPAAGGTIIGPPLVHTYYRPNHHADFAFLRAIQRGVRAHHWRFGDMPPVTGIDQGKAEQVVAYIRYLQQGMGIE